MAEGSTSKKDISNTEKPEEVKNSPKISTKHKRSGKLGVDKESRRMEEMYHDHVTVSRGGYRGRPRGYYGNRGRGGHQYKRRYYQEKGNIPPDTPLVNNSSSTDDKTNEVPIQKTTPSDNESVIIKHGNKRHSMRPRHQHTNASTNVKHSSNNKSFNRESGSGHKKQVTLQSNELAQQLTAGTYECMVCCEKVKNRQDIWGCPCCYNLFHLKCISRWARSPAAAVNEDDHDKGWRCPGCQNSSTVIPSVYKCFCGRVTNPGERRGRGDMTVPHSCGETCYKKLATTVNDTCHHKCHQLCHPGPCPPCPVTVLRKCPCGKSSSRVRCSHCKTLPSCGETCGKQLKCLRHTCPEVCHEGVCQSCTIEVEVSCFCKRDKKTFKCGEIMKEVGGVSISGYSCKRICNKLLSCGNHTCEEACHEGDCPPCTLLPSTVTTCPCGATPIDELLPTGIARTSCLDTIPTCDKQCLKPHPCGNSREGSAHLCQAKCHIGDCPLCVSTSYAYCKCGKTSMKVSCREVEEKSGFECNRVCRKPMSCGRHKCQVKCCVSDDHECRRVCGRKFSCGIHTCPDVCHTRGCGPCWNISYEELTCHCGGEVLLPPIQCGTPPPICPRSCARPHPCNHTVTHTCHDEEACPPCTFLTEKLCMGEHTFRQYIPCHLKDVSCGMPCGKPLPCGMHSCRKTCHKGACQGDNETCTQPCTRERKYCSHSCSTPCHPDSPCPDTPCNAKVTLTCACGYNSKKTQCLASSTEVMSMAFQKFHQKDIGSLLRELQSGQSVQINSISLQNLKERRLDCNEECAQFERNRKLAEALEIEDADYSPTIGGSQYSSYLLEQARGNRDFVESIEATMKQLVTNAHQLTADTAKHTFKPMKKNHRQIIHELAVHYECTTISYDPEPIRNVVVTATKKSCVPSILLSRYCNIESSGKVRVMPPPVAMKMPSQRHVPEIESQSKTTIPDYFNDEIV